MSAILEHEAIAGLTTGKPSGLRGRVLGGSRREENRANDEALDQLIKAVSYSILNND